MTVTLKAALKNVSRNGLRLLALLVACHGALAAEAQIIVLLSQDAPPYLQALEGFQAELQARGTATRYEIVEQNGDAGLGRKAIEERAAQPPQIILTLGSLATEAAAAAQPAAPVLAGLILNAQELAGIPDATGVVLEFSLDTELQWLQRFLPAGKSVAVLYSPQENQARVDRAIDIARKLGIDLKPRAVDAPRNLPDSLEASGKEADFLWGIADQVVMTPQTAKPVLLFSFRNQIPLAGLSLPWVKAGALYALERDYRDIGAQLADSALKILHGTRASAIPVAVPRRVSYAINLKTARHMKLDLPAELIKGAASVIE